MSDANEPDTASEHQPAEDQNAQTGETKKPLEPALVLDRRPRFADGRQGRPGWAMAVASVCGVVALGLVLNFILEFRRESVLDAIEEDANRAVQIADSEAKQDAVDRANQTRWETVMASELRFGRVRRTLTGTKEDIEGLREKERQLASLRSELFSGDVGLKAASDVSVIDRTITLVDELDDESGPTAAEIKADFAAAASPVLDAETVPADYEPSQDLQEVLDDLAREVRSRERFLNRAVRSLTSLIDDAEGVRQTSSVSLADAVATRRDAKARALLDAERRRKDAEAARIAKEKTDQEIAEMNRVAKADAEVRRREAEAKVEVRNREAESLRKANERAALEAEFRRDLPTIRTHLDFLLADGTTQRGNSKALDPGPVSYSYLQLKGATVQDRDGLVAFVRVMDPMRNKRSDREKYRWAFLGVTVSQQAMDSLLRNESLREAHRLLAKYGELLVEKGMLDP